MKVSNVERKMRTHVRNAFYDYMMTKDHFAFRYYSYQMELLIKVFPKTNQGRLENIWSNNFKKWVEGK